MVAEAGGAVLCRQDTSARIEQETEKTMAAKKRRSRAPRGLGSTPHPNAKAAVESFEGAVRYYREVASEARRGTKQSCIIAASSLQKGGFMFGNGLAHAMVARETENLSRKELDRLGQKSGRAEVANEEIGFKFLDGCILSGSLAGLGRSKTRRRK